LVLQVAMVLKEVPVLVVVQVILVLLVLKAA
jgi:hypothetical protein